MIETRNMAMIIKTRVKKYKGHGHINNVYQEEK